MAKFDVIVIGGGPAGSAAAIACRQRGLSVALVEQGDFPRHRPGETLPPGVEPLLENLGLPGLLQQEQALRHAGQWVSWGAAPRFTAFGGDVAGAWQGFQMPRARLDALLLQQAREIGASVRQPCRAMGLQVHAGKAVGLHTSQGQLECTHLIDASGPHAWLSRQLNLPTQHCSGRLLAQYGYVIGQSPDVAGDPHLVADAYGWYWIAQIEPELFHWTRLFFDRRAAAQGSVPAPLQHLPAHGAVRGADVTWRIQVPVCAPGFYLAGDAAYLLDPASSHGVLKALMSGILAAHAIVGERTNPQAAAEIRGRYQEWMRQGFVRDMRAMRAFYQAHPYAPWPLAYSEAAAPFSPDS